LGALVLMLPVAINGYPLLFYDTPGYVNSGDGILKRVGLAERVAPAATAPSGAMAAAPAPGPAKKQEATAFSDARSIYYGLIASLSKRLGGFHLTALLQALWVAAAMVLAMRHTGPRSLKGQTAMLVASATLGGAAFTTSMILPDMAGGVLLLAFAVTAAYADRLRRLEWTFWLLSIIAAICFHKAFLLVAVALFIVAGLVPGRPLWRGKTGLLVGSSIALATLLTFGSELAVERVTGVKTPHTPFLLARVVADGTAEDFLREDCPRRHWATCSMVSGMPMTPNQFLWAGMTRDGIHVPGWVQLPVSERARISAESREIVRRTIARDPWGQLRASMSNAIEQFIRAGVTRYHQSEILVENLTHTMPQEAPRVRAGLIYARPEFLRIATVVMMVSTLGSALLLLVFSVARLASGRRDTLAVFTAMVLIGAVLNAGLCGALAVVVDRYQGRLAWTLLFAALALASAWATSRRVGKRSAAEAATGSPGLAS
jgi:MFS family permease